MFSIVLATQASGVSMAEPREGTGGASNTLVIATRHAARSIAVDQLSALEQLWDRSSSVLREVVVGERDEQAPEWQLVVTMPIGLLRYRVGLESELAAARVTFQRIVEILGARRDCGVELALFGAGGSYWRTDSRWAGGTLAKGAKVEA